MSNQDLHESMQNSVLKIINWVLFFITILVIIALYRDNRTDEVNAVVGMLAAMTLAIVLMYRGKFEVSSYLAVTSLTLTATRAAFIKAGNPMGIYELGTLINCAIALACLLARKRWFPIAAGAYGMIAALVFGLVIQPPLIGHINVTDTSVTIMALGFVTIVADRIFLLTGSIMNHFKQGEFIHDMRRKQVSQIAEHSLTGQALGNDLDTQTRVSEGATLELQSVVQQFSEHVHALDSAMKEFAVSNRGISEAAGNIMGVFNRHRDGLENYRGKAETISETSQEIDFITQTKRSELTELMRVAQDGETRMQRSMGAIEKVAENSKNMLNMISLIMEVAERTNVLALNAAVEASRAGKAGGGFAIVAKEIKNLSTETTQNADVINRSLRTNIKSIEEAVEIIRHAGDAFVGINVSLTDFSAAIDDIVQRVNGLSEQNIQMSTETKDILTLVDEVQQVLERMLLSIEQSSSKASLIQNTSDNLDTGMKDLQAKSTLMRTTVHRIQEIQKDYSHCASRVGEIVTDLSDMAERNEPA